MSTIGNFFWDTFIYIHMYIAFCNNKAKKPFMFYLLMHYSNFEATLYLILNIEDVSTMLILNRRKVMKITWPFQLTCLNVEWPKFSWSCVYPCWLFTLYLTQNAVFCILMGVQKFPLSLYLTRDGLKRFSTFAFRIKKYTYTV